MSSNIYGESSRGYKSEDDIHPPQFKKARFIWEVKGNYHLKGTNNGNTSNSTMFDENVNKHSSDNVTAKNDHNIRDNCCVTSFLKKAEQLLDFDSDIDDDETLTYNRDVCNHSYREKNVKDQDVYLLQWHARQMARYNIENTINRALEACMADHPNKYANLDISDIVEEAESDMEINDEGILMAIESHGLKTNINLDTGAEESADEVSNKISEHMVRSEHISNNSEAYDVEPITQNISLVSGMSKLYEMNANDFWNTAVSAAIIEKGLLHPTN